MKNKILIILYVIFGISAIALVITLIINIRKLNINSDQVQKTYSLIKSNDLANCNGMIFYNENKLSYDTLEMSKKLCMAYNNITKVNINTKTIKKYKNSSYCLINDQEKITLSNDNNCDVEVISLKELDNKYYTIFGKNIGEGERENFFVNSKKTCYYDENNEEYICANPLSQKLEVGWNPYYYQMIYKAVKGANTIKIYDYFLLVNNRTVYTENEGKNFNIEATDKYNDSGLIIDKNFLKKYGQRYEHTFKKDKNGDYYWVSSNPL